MSRFSEFRKTSLFILYIAGFIVSLRAALPSYITSSFLSSLVGEKLIGYLFAAGSTITIILFYFTPRILRKFGNYKTCLALAFLSMATLLGVALLKNHASVIFLFVVSSAASTVVGLCLDIFIEHDSTNMVTGNIRGIYLATLNTAWLISPFLSALVLSAFNYQSVFFIAALMMIPFLIVIYSRLKNFVDPEYTDFALWQTVKELSQKRDVRFITVANFLLQFFYAWMTIYTPLYLHTHIGFDWLSIGEIFTVMLVPFVILEAPLGKLADQRLGEKEMLTGGFVIMALSTAILAFVTSKNIFIWAALLFITRVGAAMVETMCDTYFFKKIGDKDANLISLYRSMVPIVYVISPIVATILLIFMPMAALFVVLGIMMLCGLHYSLGIKDTI
jgi:MFS family permease